MHGAALHKALLSVHLVGVFIMLMGIGLLLITVLGLRRAKTVENLRQVLYAGRYVEKIMPLGTLVVLVAGVWMAFLGNQRYTWHSAWIITAFILVVIFSVNGAANIGKRMERIAHEAFGKATGGPLSPKLLAMCNDPALHYTSWAAIGVIFSFIVLMVEKPGWLGSVITVVVAVAAGLIVNWLVSKPAGTPKAAPVRKTAR